MRVIYSESVEYKVLNRLKRIRGSVVLRTDLEGLGSYRQISRALNKLMAGKQLIRIGSGIYAKAFLSKYSDIPLAKNGIDSTLRYVLTRLNVQYEPGSAEREYNAGRTTQIPVRNVVRLRGRCRRRLGYGNAKLFFEKNINAK